MNEIGYWKWLFNLLNIRQWKKFWQGALIIVVAPVIAFVFVGLTYEVIGIYSIPIGIAMFLLLTSYGYYFLEEK